jgi:hypothetical protein
MARSTFLNDLTTEERQAIFKAAQEERECIIQKAINNGASVNYMTSRLTLDEQETHILTCVDGSCIIDTTIPSDIKLCIKRGWEITSVTYYENTNHQRSKSESPGHKGARDLWVEGF